MIQREFEDRGFHDFGEYLARAGSPSMKVWFCGTVTWVLSYHENGAVCSWGYDAGDAQIVKRIDSLMKDGDRFLPEYLTGTNVGGTMVTEKVEARCRSTGF